MPRPRTVPHPGARATSRGTTPCVTPPRRSPGGPGARCWSCAPRSRWTAIPGGTPSSASFTARRGWTPRPRRCSRWCCSSWPFCFPGPSSMRRPEAWALALTAFADPRSADRQPAHHGPALRAERGPPALPLPAGRARDRTARPGTPGGRGAGQSCWPASSASWSSSTRSWHLFLLAVAACILARRFRLAAILAAGLGLGVLVAGLLHGDVIEFVQQSLLHTVLALGVPSPASELAIEFRRATARRAAALASSRCCCGAGPRGLEADVVSGAVRARRSADGSWASSSCASGRTGERRPSSPGWPWNWSTRSRRSFPSARRPSRLAAVAASRQCSRGCRSTGAERLQAADRPDPSLARAAATPALPGPGGILYTRRHASLLPALLRAGRRRRGATWSATSRRSCPRTTSRRSVAWPGAAPASFEPWVREDGAASTVSSCRSPKDSPGSPASSGRR